MQFDLQMSLDIDSNIPCKILKICFLFVTSKLWASEIIQKDFFLPINVLTRDANCVTF